MTAHFTLVAEENGVITGFGDMDSSGYLDRLYVHRDFQGKGIASVLCDRLIKEQQVERQGILLTNFVMEKQQS